MPSLILPGATDKGDGPGRTENVFFWIRADRQHIAALPVVYTTGLLVDTWLDQTLYAHHVFGTLTGRPVVSVNAIPCDVHLRDSILFDGVSDVLQSAIIDEPVFHFTGKQQISVHIAFRASNNTDGTIFSLGNTGAQRGDGFSVSIVPNGVIGRITLGLDCGSGVIVTTFSLPSGFIYDDGNVHTISFMFDGTALVNQLRLVIDNFNIPLTITTSGGMFADSNIITIGDDPNGGFPFGGDLLEVISQNVSSESNRAVFYDYYVRKWCAV